MILLTDEEIDGIFVKEEWISLEDCDVRIIAQAQLKKTVEYIKEQGKYNLSGLSQLDFFGSPMWQTILKEGGINELE